MLKIKAWLMTAVGFLVLIAMVLYYKGKVATVKRKFAEYKERQALKTIQAETAAHEADIQARKDEHEEVADALKDNRNDYFE